VTGGGLYQGWHYTSYVTEVRALKRAGRLGEAEVLLIGLVDAVEAESEKNGWGVAPWYYEQLAIVYRKQKRPLEELAILERYAAQRHAPGAKPAKLMERLEKVRSNMDQL